jgi:CPA1 family monovalent cation:H+ antiporter
MEYVLVIGIAALVLVAVTNLLAARLPVPAPVIQTVLGVILAFIPGIPAIHLDPDFVLLAVLPPLVYAAAVKLPWADFVTNLRAIAMMAFGLVGVTVAVIAVVAHSIIPGLPWAAALVLGAIVSPTDPVASTALASRIGVPQRLVAILEGEGLVNDAVALTIKAIAIGALMGGSVAISTGVLKFVIIVAGEIAYGWAIGWLISAVRKRIEDPITETIVTLITPFAAYLIPASLGGSGVLATVATGMYIGEQQPELVPSGTRLHLTSVWEVIVYALNGTLFLLTGLQARFIWSVKAMEPRHILLYGMVIALVAIVLRFCWTWPAAWLPRRVWPQIRRNDPMPSPRHLTFIAWSGMRGAISLAAALSIPASVQYRSLIVFITACVIAATLVVQGTTLPWLIRLLRLDKDAKKEKVETQKSEARARTAVAAAVVEELKSERNPIADRVRQDYELIANGSESATSEREIDMEAGIRHKVINVQRQRVIDMHRKGNINDFVLRRIERDLDLQEAALENRLAGPEM